MTPDTALSRLRQYGERTSTWSTATYDTGTEKALHEIALALATEADRLKRSAVLAEEDYQRIVRGACQIESQLRARVTELETSIAPRLCSCGHSRHAHTVPAPHSCFAYGQTCPCPTYRQLPPDEAWEQQRKNIAAREARAADEDIATS
ncbi:hypothetical protein [Streptomyces sp. NPDC047985]|uniref:hypothetical protein n=1 Tax=Streptomyces sp. NPDC047985 TaxID=3155384 RepID=UPI003445BEED